MTDLGFSFFKSKSENFWQSFKRGLQKTPPAQNSNNSKSNKTLIVGNVKSFWRISFNPIVRWLSLSLKNPSDVRQLSQWISYIRTVKGVIFYLDNAAYNYKGILQLSGVKKIEQGIQEPTGRTLMNGSFQIRNSKCLTGKTRIRKSLWHRDWSWLNPTQVFEFGSISPSVKTTSFTLYSVSQKM